MAVCFKVWEDGDHYGFGVKLCDSRAVSAELLLPKADAVLAQNPLASKEKSHRHFASSGAQIINAFRTECCSIAVLFRFQSG